MPPLLRNEELAEELQTNTDTAEIVSYLTPRGIRHLRKQGRLVCVLRNLLVSSVFRRPLRAAQSAELKHRAFMRQSTEHECIRGRKKGKIRMRTKHFAVTTRNKSAQGCMCRGRSEDEGARPRDVWCIWIRKRFMFFTSLFFLSRNVLVSCVYGDFFHFYTMLLLPRCCCELHFECVPICSFIVPFVIFLLW